MRLLVKPEIMNKYYGESEAHLRQKFEEAEANAMRSRESQSIKVIGGLALSELNERVRAELEIDVSLRGVVILDVEPGSNAQKKGLLVGDIIVEVGQKLVETPKQFEEQLKVSKSKGG